MSSKKHIRTGTIAFVERGAHVFSLSGRFASDTIGMSTWDVVHDGWCLVLAVKTGDFWTEALVMFSGPVERPIGWVNVHNLLSWSNP